MSKRTKRKKRKAGQWFPLATGVHFEGHCSHESARTLRGCHLSLNSSHQFKIPHCIAMKRGVLILHCIYMYMCMPKSQRSKSSIQLSSLPFPPHF